MDGVWKFFEIQYAVRYILMRSVGPAPLQCPLLREHFLSALIGKPWHDPHLGIFKRILFLLLRPVYAAKNET